MEKLLRGVLSLLVVFFAGNYFYQNYILEETIEPEIIIDGDVYAACVGGYHLEDNSYSIDCDITDEDAMLSEDNPMYISIYDGSNLVTQELVLFGEQIDIIFDTLPYSSVLDIVVTYDEETYFTDNFITKDEFVVVPTVLITPVTITDTSIEIDISYSDTEERLVQSILTVTDGDGLVVGSYPYSSFDNTTVSFTDLTQLQEYTFSITMYYTYSVSTDTLETLNEVFVTTEKTYLHPVVDISNILIDNNLLTFDLLLSSNDATLDEYTVVIRDETTDYFIDALLPNMSFDISEIIGDFTIDVIATYTLDEVVYTELNLVNYEVVRDYSNFFTLSNLQYVDTSQAITTYEDFKYYVFTYVDQGVFNFRIDCDAAITCETFHSDPTYMDELFQVNYVIHTYYSYSYVSYSYTTSFIEIELTPTYSDVDISIMNAEVKSILDTIITETMTEEEKIQAIHDYVVQVTEYDDGCADNSQTCDTDHVAQGVLFDGNAVCEGYSHATDVLLRSLGIPSVRVVSETHMWNGVYYNDTWLHLDTTWDDPAIGNSISYDYYLIDTTTLYANDDSGIHNFIGNDYPYIN